ncbi:MAG TPA: molybdopterin-dependent oxidoreductase [Jatrophihabitantaceae bacterium]|nr:molybdopterin-dependent oxidoreductase [Jatrophihabitantaceae bacterium]
MRRGEVALGAVAGLVAGGVTLAVGELVAAFVRPAAAPVIAVGNRVIVLTPESIKRWATREFGTNDKSVLLTGIYLLLGACAVVVGILAVRWLWAGVVGVAALGGFAVYCALTAPGHHTGDAVPAILGAIAGVIALRGLLRSAETSASRRRFLGASAALAGGALAVGFGGRALQHARHDVSKQRAALKLPPPASPAPVASGADLGKGAVPFDTPNARFYRIDTVLTFPQIDPKHWRLRIHGQVERELTLSYDDLLRRPLVERWITLTCVSNEIGGNLISNARFLGVRLADVLREVGIANGADQLLARSYDGMTIGSPTAVVMDGRDAMLAIGMNGEPLPIAHGFPVRMVVPGLYGYVSACKWIVDLEATTFADAQAFWVQGGWAAQGPIRLASRIDTPQSGAKLPVGGAVPIAGIAWDQHVGVSRVEVQVDDGEWQQARLAAVPSTDTWRQWVLPWTVGPAGQHTIRVRAYDAYGIVQDPQHRDPFPSGATGYHQIGVTAQAP